MVKNEGGYALKKTLAAAAIAALAASGAANAADIYGGLKDAPVAPPPPLWTGFYIGASVGGAWGDLKTTDTNGAWAPFDRPGYSWENSPSGIIGNGQIGYNWQLGLLSSGLVIGVEADFGGFGFSGTVHPLNGAYYSDTVSGSFYTDVTGRLGYALGPTLFYLKGGWAYYDGEISLGDAGYPKGPYGAVGAPYSQRSSGFGGWTFGGGVEYKFNPKWGGKIEYRYFDFGDFRQNPYATGPWLFDRNFTASAVTAGINYYVTPVYTPLK